MDYYFITKAFVSFIAGGLYIAATLYAAERFSAKIGGILLGLPSTILISLLFIAWTSGTDAAITATTIIPIILGVNLFFVITFIYFYKFGAHLALCASFIVWFILSFLALFNTIQSMFITVVCALVLFSMAISLLKNIPNQKIINRNHSMKEFILRTCFTGTIVVVAGIFAKTLGPIWGGIFAGFPAAYSSSLLLLAKQDGIKFASAVAKYMPYGSIGNVLFVLLFYNIVPALGVLLGTIISYACSAIFGICMHTYLRK